MPSTINPSSPPQYVTTLIVPQDGDPAAAASVVGPLTTLLNDAGAGLLLLGGFCTGGKRVSVTADPNITIQPLGSVLLQNSNSTWVCLQHTMATTVDLTTIGWSPAANTRAFLYAYESSNTVAFVVSPTAPDPGLLFEAGNPKRFYVTTFFSSPFNLVLPFTQSGNVYTFNIRSPIGVGVFGNVALDQSNATSPTAVAFGRALPNYAISVTLSCRFQSTTASLEQGTVRITGGSLPSLELATSDVQVVVNDVQMTTLASTFEYFVKTSTDNLSVWISGFVT